MSPHTVTREDVVRHPGGLTRREPMTTAHLHVARFYIEAERQRPRASWVEPISAAPSPFAVDALLADFVVFGGRGASPKARAQVFRDGAGPEVCAGRGAAMSGQRVIRISTELLVQIFTTGNVFSPGRVIDGLPEGARYVRCYDPVGVSGGPCLVFEHPDWPELSEGVFRQGHPAVRRR